jgi:hypothetical protein
MFESYEARKLESLKIICAFMLLGFAASKLSGLFGGYSESKLEKTPRNPLRNWNFS